MNGEPRAMLEGSSTVGASAASWGSLHLYARKCRIVLCCYEMCSFGEFCVCSLLSSADWKVPVHEVYGLLMPGSVTELASTCKAQAVTTPESAHGIQNELYKQGRPALAIQIPRRTVDDLSHVLMWLLMGFCLFIAAII